MRAHSAVVVVVVVFPVSSVTQCQCQCLTLPTVSIPVGGILREADGPPRLLQQHSTPRAKGDN